MFGIQPVEAGLLLLCLVGVAAAVAGRWTGVLSLRASLVALVVALVIPVAGSLLSLAMFASGWRQRRRAVRTTA